MPTYVSLIHWTDQGIKNYKDTTTRAADFSKLVESSGGRVRELLWTVGEYDLVTVVDFPDDETSTAALLQVGSLGSIRSNTLRAFNAEEMGAIIRRAGYSKRGLRHIPVSGTGPRSKAGFRSPDLTDERSGIRAGVRARPPFRRLRLTATAAANGRRQRFGASAARLQISPRLGVCHA
jgi:uncharacterized protein with GYD domain